MHGLRTDVPESGMMVALVISIFRRKMQEDHTSQVILGYTTRSYLETPNIKAK